MRNQTVDDLPANAIALPIKGRITSTHWSKARQYPKAKKRPQS